MTGNQKINHNDFSSEIISESKASELLVSIFSYLDNACIPYCVERNYENYPKKLTGDIDLIIGNDQLKNVAKEIIALAFDNGWRCYQKYIWEKTAYIGLSLDCFPERFALTVELFSGARWHGIEFLDSASIVNKCG